MAVGGDQGEAGTFLKHENGGDGSLQMCTVELEIPPPGLSKTSKSPHSPGFSA